MRVGVHATAHGTSRRLALAAAPRRAGITLESGPMQRPHPQHWSQKRRRRPHRAGIALESHWNRAGIALESHWNRTGIALESHWNHAGIRPNAKTPPPPPPSAPHSKRAAYAPVTCTAEAHVRSARSLSYAPDACIAVEWRMACATAFLRASSELASLSKKR